MQKFVIAIIFITVGGIALLAWEPAGPAGPRPARLAGEALPLRAPSGASAGAMTTAATTRSGEVIAPESVTHKYRYLLDDLGPSQAQRARVLDLLAQRESLVRQSGPEDLVRPRDPALTRQLDDIDAALRLELAPSAYASYEMLRESDVEQFHLEEYTGGIHEYAPLDATQERAVLEAKLRQKREYANLVADAGLDRESLSLAEREHAMAMVERGLNEYRLAYLAEVAPLLDERQYNLLSNYEATEFQQELERLQQIINAR
jgi:hypothetical protein